MKTMIPAGKSGSILVILMAILVAFSLMVAALLKGSTFNELETIQLLHTTQAHWLAEAGLEKELSQILASQVYRGCLRSTLSLELDEDFPEMPDFHYRVWVSKDDIYGTAESAYHIVSTGEVLGVTAGVSIDMTCTPGSDCALINLTGSTEISPNVHIDGSIYQEQGQLSISHPVTLTGYAETAEGVAFTTHWRNDITKVEVDPISFPWLDCRPYKTLIDYANNTNNATVIQGNTTYTDPVNLNGETVYVHGDIIIKKNITGGGTIVASGKIILNHPQLNVGPNVTFAAQDNIIIRNQITMGGNTKVFSMSDIEISNGGITGASTTFIAMNNVTFSRNTSFSGIIYAENKIDIGQASDLQGVIIARNGILMAPNTQITYDSSVFAKLNPIDWGDQLLITQMKWTESR